MADDRLQVIANQCEQNEASTLTAISVLGKALAYASPSMSENEVCDAGWTFHFLAEIHEALGSFRRAADLYARDLRVKQVCAAQERAQ